MFLRGKVMKDKVRAFIYIDVKSGKEKEVVYDGR